MLGVASLWAGQDYIASQGGVEKLHSREMKLARRLVEGLREIDEVHVYCCEDMENHLSTVTVNVEGLEAGDVGIMLDVDFNIATRTGLHCAPLVHEQIGTMPVHGGVRFSIGAFNTQEDIDAAVRAMEEITTRVKK
jgi:selenocysteine lyase/cysteine desulfurase